MKQKERKCEQKSTSFSFCPKKRKLFLAIYFPYDILAKEGEKRMEILQKVENKTRGICLDDQYITLFSLCQEENAKQKVANYLEQYRLAELRKVSEKISEKWETKAKRLIYQIFSMPDEAKRELFSFLTKYRFTIQDYWNEETKLTTFLQEKEALSWKEQILELRTYFELPSPGLLDFLVDEQGNPVTGQEQDKKPDWEKTFAKVQEAYARITGNLPNGKKRYTSVYLTKQSRFSMVVKGGETYFAPLKKGISWARKHGMKVYLPALIDYRDYPNNLVGKGKDEYLQALKQYLSALCTTLKEYRPEVFAGIELGSEWIYADEPYEERRSHWHNRLEVADILTVLCQMKQELPELTMVYRDFGLDIPEKRAKILELVKEIRTYEKEKKVHLLDGMNWQISYLESESVEQIQKALQEWKEVTSLPIHIFLQEKPIKRGFKKPPISTEKQETIEKVEKWHQDDIVRSILQSKYIDSVYIVEETGGRRELNKVANSINKEELNLWKQWRKTVPEIRKETRQDFNYHTHTRRCGHAEDVSDEVLIQNAIQAGMKKLAFTDHIPFDPQAKHHIIRPKVRMDYAEFESYLKSIEHWKKKYQGQIEITSGVEFEYARQDKAYLQDMRKRVDKMVLGQHFVVDSKGHEYRLKEFPTDENLDLYADLMVEAMELKLPDIVVHPDYFLSKREGFGKKEEEITRKLCQAAEKYHIPFEINLGQIGVQEKNTPAQYPNRNFWKIASEYQIGVIYGKDAHWSEQILDESIFEIADKMIGRKTIQKLTFLESDLMTKKPVVKTFFEQLKELDEEIPEAERANVQKDLAKMRKKQKSRKE